MSSSSQFVHTALTTRAQLPDSDRKWFLSTSPAVPRPALKLWYWADHSLGTNLPVLGVSDWSDSFNDVNISKPGFITRLGKRKSEDSSGIGLFSKSNIFVIYRRFFSVLECVLRSVAESYLLVSSRHMSDGVKTTRNILSDFFKRSVSLSVRLNM